MSKVPDIFTEWTIHTPPTPEAMEQWKTYLKSVDDTTDKPKLREVIDAIRARKANDFSGAMKGLTGMVETSSKPSILPVEE